MARPNVAGQLIDEVESLHLNKRGYPASSFQEALATVVEMAQPDQLEEKRLTVSTAYPNDAGLNRARLKPETMEQLSVDADDPVQIRGESTTVATVRPMDGPDAARSAIRIDGFTRDNAGIAEGDVVVIRRIEVEPAQCVTFAVPAQVVSNLDVDEQGFSVGNQALVGDRVVTRGDTVPVVATEKDLATEENPFKGAPGDLIPVDIADFQPAEEDTVRITDETEIEVQWP